MGNFATHVTKYTAPHLWQEDTPDPSAPIQYDPMFGFENNERKIKVLEPSEEEMDSVNLPLDRRDFCAYHRIAWRGCVNQSAPFYWKCSAIMDDLRACVREGFINDMKEFEREKRLNARERRIREAQLE